MSIHVCERCRTPFEYSGRVKRCENCRNTCEKCGKPSGRNNLCKACKPNKRRMVKCKHPDCQTMIREEKRGQGYCQKHYDRTNKSFATILFNKLTKSKPKHLKYKTGAIKSVPRKCAVCGSDFLATPDAVKKGNGTVCSPRCHGIRAAQLTPKKRTSIEVAIAEAMRRRGWRFEEQKTIKGISIVDFYVPSLNAIIFCDGDYWHSLLWRIPKDKRVTQELIDLGYRVYRFWEKDIRQSPDECLNQIR
jgi:DNA mismatch endonuclease (patch repair protein)